MGNLKVFIFVRKLPNFVNVIQPCILTGAVL